VLAATTLASSSAKWKTICRYLAKFGLDPLPPSADKVVALGAALKAGAYKSAPTYFSLYRTVAVRQGHLIDDAVAQAIRDMSRSCLRGLGGPVRALALPMERFRELPAAATPFVQGGPIGPRNMCVVGAWWLLREIEISTLRAALVQITLEARSPRACLQLLASKTDQRALGVSRTHGCGCADLAAPSPSCPVHAAWDQLLTLQRLFPGRWRGNQPDLDLPLFPSELGEVCGKPAVVATLLASATLLGVPRASPDGSERVSGHSLRAAGAQGLARAGIDLWAIQLLGRWGSDAVKGYVREAHLARSAEWARQAMRSRSLEEVVAEAAPIVAAARVNGATLPEAMATACADLGLRPSDPAAGKADLCEQLVAPVLTCAATDAEYAPPAVVTEAARHGIEEELAAQEQREAIIVFNGSSGVAHRAVPATFDLASDLQTSACGWRYGRAPDATFPDEQSIPAGHRALCGKCFPRWRALRKRADPDCGLVQSHNVSA